jgi:hypothetical protein
MSNLNIMSKLFKTGLIGLFLLISLSIVPTSVLAVDPPCDLNNHKLINFGADRVCIPTDAIGFSTALYSIGLGLIGGVGVLFVMYGGYVILSSQGNPEQLRKGKSYIYFAIAGIVLAFSGYALYQAIGSNILRIPGFT